MTLIHKFICDHCGKEVDVQAAEDFIQTRNKWFTTISEDSVRKDYCGMECYANGAIIPKKDENAGHKS